MRLAAMHIERFRALQSIDLVFQPMTVIIGENDVGKTSCMLAVQSLFERKKLESKTDFFQGKTENPVVIDATFRCPAPTEEQSPFLSDESIRLRCTYTFNQPRQIEARKRIPKDESFRNIDGQNVPELRDTLKRLELLPDGKPPSKPDAQRILKSHIEGLSIDQFSADWVSVSEAEFSKLLPDFVVVSVARSLDDALKMTDTSLLGRLFRPLMKATMQAANDANALGDIRAQLKESVNERVADLELLMRQQLNNSTIRLTHEVDFDPLKGLTFDFGMDDERAKGIPIANRGAGVHNNLILAMFRLLAQYKAQNFLIAIEEPENSLHPRGQREMLWALQGLAKSAQVICTTHSSIFLDLGQLEDNIVLTRTAKGNTIARTFQANDDKEMVALREILGIRISDALLSGGGNCALIVEGATELYAYPHFFSIAGHNARALGVSIISADGSDTQKIQHILRVLNVYGIPAVVVLDKDAKRTYDDLKGYGPGGELPNLRRTHWLEDGTFETYIPLQVALDVINESFPGRDITEDDIDMTKDRLKEFGKALHAHKGPGARIEAFKVRFGQLVGERMVSDGHALPLAIAAVIAEVKEIAEQI